MKTAQDIAGFIKAKGVFGDAGVTVEKLCGASDIQKESIVCVDNKKLLNEIINSEAKVLVVDEEIKDKTSKTFIIVENVKEAFFKLLTYFYPYKQYNYGIVQKSACINENAKVSPLAYIGHNVVVGENSVIGERTAIESNSVIGDNVVIGNNCIINANVTIHDESVLGDRVIIGSSSVIGGDGFGFFVSGGKQNKIPQRGNVVIGDDTELGASVMIDRAVIGSTRIGNDVKIDNMVHIAHNCSVGDHTIIVAQVGIAGSSHIGKWCVIAGQVGIADHANIEDNVIIAAQAGVMSNAKIESGSILFGSPVQSIDREKLCMVSYRKLPELIEAVEEVIGKRIRVKK